MSRSIFELKNLLKLCCEQRPRLKFVEVGVGVEGVVIVVLEKLLCSCCSSSLLLSLPT